ncbi:Agamous-like MADS-box protein AGL80 [Morella rubra]|uniref:Agamous-like MADS-box protein AGL80 n=1 Tax=Morella rubra TaxID=262757 RepID=A0A6A1W589_9ROSI|nr:Agamous-like MADS-box protein AGL80 [Morella rubra]
MTRKKVKLTWIVNDSSRKASFKKRRGGLLKKVSELTILCDVRAFIIVYGPDSDEAVVWPSPKVVQQLLAEFQSKPEMERCKKMMNQETYLRERATKVQDQLRKQQTKNKEMEMGHLMHQIQQGKKMGELKTSEMAGLGWLLEEKMKDCQKRQECSQQGPLTPNVFPPPQDAAPADETDDSSTAAGERIPPEPCTWDQWFMDMINQNENAAAGSSSVRNNMGLQPHTYFGGLSGASDMGLPCENPGGSKGVIEMEMPLRDYGGSSGRNEMGGLPYWNFGINSGIGDLGLPPGSFRGIAGGGGDMGMGLPYNWNMRGSIVGATTIGMGMPHGNIDNGGAGSDMGLPPPGLFGGSSAGTDAGLPYDISKPWSNFFSP